MKDCIFCKIVAGSIPSKKLGESEHLIAISDIQGQAPFHALIIPKVHKSSLNDLDSADRAKFLPEMYSLADELASKSGFREQGYRTVINNQSMAGQTVFHLHMHVLSGAQLKGSFGA